MFKSLVPLILVAAVVVGVAGCKRDELRAKDARIAELEAQLGEALNECETKPADPAP